MKRPMTLGQTARIISSSSRWSFWEKLAAITPRPQINLVLRTSTSSRRRSPSTPRLAHRIGGIPQGAHKSLGEDVRWFIRPSPTRRLGPSKDQEWCNVVEVSVCCLERGEVLLSAISLRDEVCSPPRKSLATKLHYQRVRHESRMTAVSVWEGMDLDEPVVEPDADLVRTVCRVLNPVARIVKQEF